MTYALIENGAVTKYPVNLAQEFPHISRAPGALPAGVVFVTPTSYPNHDHTQDVIEGTPELVDGIWRQTWVLVPRSEEEIGWAIEAALEGLRIERDARLLACDWTQLGDSPLTSAQKADWAAYRQALRNLPATNSDPFNPEWPVPPSL